MPPVDAHAVVHHRVLDFIDDSCPGSFDAQSFLHLQRARMSGSSCVWDATVTSLCPPLLWRFTANPVPRIGISEQSLTLDPEQMAEPEKCATKQLRTCWQY